MKKLIYKLRSVVLSVLFLSLSSCGQLLDDDATDYGDSPDFVGFRRAAVTAPFEVDGQTKNYNARFELFGPGLFNFREDVTVTYEVDEANSTARAGVDYSLDGSNTITLNNENDFIGLIPITIITEGIEPPVSKTLTFNITSVSVNNADVVISDTGKRQVVTISYNCFADLGGTYTMTNTACTAEVEGITISANDEGGWDLSTADGGLLQYCTSNTGLVNNGSILVVCGEVLPTDSPAFCGSNGVGCITGGTWDAENGILTLQNNSALFGAGDYTSTYTRVQN